MLNDPLEALYRVALSLGLRRGEALGLRWEDLDLERRTLRVAVSLGVVNGKLVLGEPKTATSRRTLELPAALVTALRVHRARQLEERLLAGSRWQETGFVFTSSVGTPIHPGNLLKAFHALLNRAGLPRVRFHDLRHSYASLLAAQGISARVAMEMLGHSDIRVTQNIYTHVFEEARHEVTDAISRALGDVG
ncbi:MAG TPA: site-specific integrase [Herpetosiphonaceae bacterium]|nr:site-specific integrase [Herpetosiphonaceae bacterium]